MAWKSPFVVYRFSSEKQVTEIFQCDDLQKAKYWIKYIAEPGDVLCRTPLSNKHSKKSTAAEYWCHKEQSGQPESDETGWREKLKAVWPDFQFPQDQQG